MQPLACVALCCYCVAIVLPMCCYCVANVLLMRRMQPLSSCCSVLYLFIFDPRSAAHVHTAHGMHARNARNARQTLSEAPHGNHEVGQYRVSTGEYQVSTPLAPAQGGTGRTSAEMTSTAMLLRHAQLRANSLDLLSSSSYVMSLCASLRLPLSSLACGRECL